LERRLAIEVQYSEPFQFNFSVTIRDNFPDVLRRHSAREFPKFFFRSLRRSIVGKPAQFPRQSFQSAFVQLLSRSGRSSNLISDFTKRLAGGVVQHDLALNVSQTGDGSLKPL
jgi:hypothetical protein